jgi:hypothetical protein
MGQAQITLRFSWDLGTAEGSLPPGFAEALSVAVAGERMIHNIQLINSAKEPLQLGDVGPGGLLVGRNNGDGVLEFTGSVSPSCVPFCTLKPGDVMLVRLNGVAPYVGLPTGSSNFEYWLLAP